MIKIKKPEYVYAGKMCQGGGPVYIRLETNVEFCKCCPKFKAKSKFNNYERNMEGNRRV